MAVNRVSVLKRCRSLGLDPIYLGIDKKSTRQLNRTQTFFCLHVLTVLWIFYQFLSKSDPGRGICIFSEQELYLLPFQATS